MLAKSRYLVFTLDFLLPIFILLGIGIGVWIVLGSRVFKISMIVCNSNYEPCKNEAVIAELDKAKGNNLFRYQVSELKDKLLSGDYMTKEVTFTKILPNQLRIDLTSVNPSFALMLDGGNSWIVCDDEGKVIGILDTNPNVPTVVTSHIPPIQIGGLIQDNNLVRAGKLSLSLRDANISVQKIVLSTDSTLNILLSSGLEVIMTTNVSDLTPQITALQQTLTDSTIKKEGYDTLDVRFAQPILKQN